MKYTTKYPNFLEVCLRCRRLIAIVTGSKKTHQQEDYIEVDDWHRHDEHGGFGHIEFWIEK